MPALPKTRMQFVVRMYGEVEGLHTLQRVHEIYMTQVLGQLWRLADLEEVQMESMLIYD